LKKGLLIVDGNPASRMYPANFPKVKAPTGKEGLITAWCVPPDLVPFDPTLNDISDREFIHKLRNNPRTRRIPLVALSRDGCRLVKLVHGLRNQ
jgi:CheY-like chemotaxis protein